MVKLSIFRGSSGVYLQDKRRESYLLILALKEKDLKILPNIPVKYLYLMLIYQNQLKKWGEFARISG